MSRSGSRGAPLSRWSQYGNADPVVMDGWCSQVLAGPSVLFAANGLTLDAAGHLVVTQLFGGQVSRVDPSTGASEVVLSPSMGATPPDDAIHLHDGRLALTEPFAGAVSIMTGADGLQRLPYDLPGANGIATDPERRRLFVTEFREQGRLVEVDPDGVAPMSVLLEDLDWPNALAEFDGALYFPLVHLGQVRAYELATGKTRIVSRDLSLPTAVKVLADGRLVVSEAGSGHITAIDPMSGVTEVLAELEPAVDNLVPAPDGTLYATHFDTGKIVAVGNGANREVLGPGLIGPYGVEVGADGTILIADGVSVKVVESDGPFRSDLHALVDFPWLITAAVRVESNVLVIVAHGVGILEWTPEIEGSDRLLAGPEQIEDPVGLVLDPDDPTRVLVCDRARGAVWSIGRDGTMERVVQGLEEPQAVARDAAGRLWVSHGTNAVSVHAGDEVVTTLEGFGAPQGIAVSAGRVLVADVERRQLVGVDVATLDRYVVMHSAPIGPPDTVGVPFGFCAITADASGFIVGCNGDGSVRRVTLKRPRFDAASL